MTTHNRPDWFPVETWADLTDDEKQIVLDDLDAAAAELGIELPEAESDDTIMNPDNDKEPLLPVSAVPVSYARIKEAQDVGRKANASKEYHKTVSTLTEAAENVKNAPLTMLTVLKQIYTAEEMNGWPLPDTDKDSPEVKGSNRLADRYSIPKQGNREAVRSSFYADMFGVTDEALEWSAVVENCRKAKKDPASAKKEYLPPAMSPSYRESLRAKMEQRITFGRTALKRAVKAHFVWQGVEDIPNLLVSLVMERKGSGKEEVANTTQPILIRHKREVDQFATLSLSQFIQLRPWALTPEQRKADDVFALLLATANRGTSDDENETADEKDKAFGDVNSVVEAALKMVTFLDKKHAALIAAMKPGKEGDETVLALGSLYYALDGVFGKPEYENRFTKVRQDAEKASGQNERKVA